VYVGPLVATLLVGVSLVAAAPAHALDGTRYASPTGTAAQDCLSLATACNIEKAVNSAEYGDEVILASGTYTTATDLEPPNNAVVRGADPANRPVINTSAAYGLWVGAGDGGGARDLEINHTGSTAAFVMSGPGTSERIIARTSSIGASACGGPYGTVAAGLLRDSLCVATGQGGSGVAFFLGAGPTTYNVGLTNVTAIATGPNGFGVQLAINGAGLVVNYAMRNVIAVGAKDVRTSTAAGATLNVTATGSRYAVVDTADGGTVTAAGSGSNITAAPVFAETTSYRPVATSPTVDAGTEVASLGSTDLDGRPRSIGSAPDMGAYELPDTVAPQTTFTKKPKKKTFARKAKFTFTSSEPGSTFRCKLDKKAAKPCTSPFKKKKLKYGKHVFQVWAVDSYGNVDATPAKYRWKVKRRG
jgi:hypothetical protein